MNKVYIVEHRYADDEWDDYTPSGYFNTLALAEDYIKERERLKPGYYCHHISEHELFVDNTFMGRLDPYGEIR